jgi:hypothetical protein
MTIIVLPWSTRWWSIPPAPTIGEQVLHILEVQADRRLGQGISGYH